ncbi:unnamed protein product [Mytilus coruscus]|uniref:Uncharacterized protein n=1 Tax=Mytilus coruscus TaxID=42192 RepID=A0A6J8DRD2_MYTCO|nr:unnamed protein product [Mytilus coruscus]
MSKDVNPFCVKSLLIKRKSSKKKKLQLRFKEKALEIKNELQVTDAKTRVIEELERSILEYQQFEETMVKGKQFDQSLTVVIVDSRKDTENSPLDPTVPAFIPEVIKERLPFETRRTCTTLQRVQDDDKPRPVDAKNNIFDYDAPYSIARELNKPKADIQKFDGNPMNYKRFNRQFNAMLKRTKLLATIHFRGIRLEYPYEDWNRANNRTLVRSRYIKSLNKAMGRVHGQKVPPRPRILLSKNQPRPRRELSRPSEHSQKNGIA